MEDRVERLDAAKLDPRIYALLIGGCEFGFFYFMRPKECGQDGIREMQCGQEFQICSDHLRWVSDLHCDDPCLPDQG